MQPLTSSLKTTEDILLNYTNVEVCEGIYVNNSIFKLFKNIEKDLSFVRIDKESQIECAVYQYAITEDLSVNIYTNAKHDYVEIAHYYEIPDFIDNNFLEVINISNQNLRIARAVYLDDSESCAEISSVYSGEFSSRSFLKFMNTLHQDIVTFHKVTNMYISKLSAEIERRKYEEAVNRKVSKAVKKNITAKSDVEITTKRKVKVSDEIKVIKKTKTD